MTKIIAMLRGTCVALAIAAGFAAAGVDAQTFPAKPVRLIVPFPPGGATDIVARMLSQKLQDIWGQTVVIEYKPGAGTVIGTDAVAKSAPDGYTLGIVITAHMINPSLRPDLPFDTVRDLAGVTTVSMSHIVLVATKLLAANTLPEVIDLARKNPGSLSYASPGAGTAMHLAGELLKARAGIEMTHVPYRGGASAYPDVITGRVQLQFDPLYAMMENITSGQVKPIAITSPARAAAAPDIPTIAETYPDFSVLSITGVVVPRATPRELVRKISADINAVLRQPDLRRRMSEVGMEPAGNTPEEFDAFIAREIAKWAPVVRAAALTAD
ncbi:MAG TPA: tripartite tricarboxylate transporter substrate binding protein [Alphaproteobacteria bacterium]